MCIRDRLNAIAVDSDPTHEIGVWAWDDNGAGGEFLPTATIQDPIWTAPGNASGATIERTLTVTASCNAMPPATNTKSVTMQELAASVVLTTSSSPTEGGSVSGGGTYLAGSTATVTATPNAEWEFTNWSGPVANAGAASTSVVMDGDKSVTANFSPVTYNYTLSVLAEPAEGGSVSGGGIYPEGAVVNITATAAAGWEFDQWNGAVADNHSAQTTVIVSGDMSVAAAFSRVQYTLTAAAEPTAGGSVAGGGVYNSGETAYVTAMPAEGWQFVNWSGSVANAGAASTSVVMDGDKSVIATFAEVVTPPTIEVTLLEIDDSGGQPESEFLPGETAWITLRAANSGGSAQVLVTLGIDLDGSSPWDYDSTALGQDQTAVLGQGESRDFTFEWATAEGLASGDYNLLGTVRDYVDFGEVYDDTEPGANTTGVGATAWMPDVVTIAAHTAPYELYRGQLHTHSNYSEGAKDPVAIYRDSNAAGMDFTALQDSERKLTASEWASLAAAAEQESSDGDFVALPGYEWKHGYQADGVYSGPYGQGHAGVLNCAEFLLTPDYTEVGRAPNAEEATADLRDFYEFIATVAPTDGTEVVAQFDHPSGGLDVLRFNNFEAPWWVDASLRKTVVERLVLFEMGTGIRTYYGPTWDPGNGLTNEVHFKIALNNGWKVAPTVSEDNKTETTPATPHRTGIWAEGLTRAAVMEALQARRIFGSDDIDFRLSVFGNGAWMGSTIALPPDNIVEFRIEWNDPTDPISDIWLVRQPDDELALDLAGKELTGDVLMTSQTVQPGEWYFVKVAQSDGDLIFSAPIWIAPRAIEVELGNDVYLAAGQTAALEAGVTNGRAPYSYAWTPADSLDDPTIANPIASPSVTTTYAVEVTDAVGETGSASVTVFVD